MIRGIGRSGGGWTYGKGPGGGMAWRLDGVESVTAGINTVLRKMKISGHRGLLSAANYVLTDADIGQSPLVPARTGNLRSSRFAEPLPSEQPTVVFGYTANYAAAVHEMLISPSGKPIDWSRSGSGPKFLEASLKRNSEKIALIVAKHVEL